MKKFILILALCLIALYFIGKNSDSDSSDAAYNAETYDIEDALDPNDEEAFMKYGVDSME